MRFFCLVAELEHVTRAADALMVSQPYLTQMINNLERELGVELFDHVGRKIKLNENGAVFYARAKKLLQDFEDARIEVQELAQQKERTVSLITNVGLYMADLLGSFNRRYPEVTIYQSSARRKDIIAALGAGLVDFAVCTPPINEGEGAYIKTQTVFTDRGFVLLPSGHQLIKKVAISARELENENLITSPVGLGMRDHVDKIFAQVNIRPKIVIESTDTAAVPTYVKAGLGFAIIPKSVGLMNPALTPDCVDLLEDPIGDTGLSWNESRYQKKTALVVRSFIVEYFANLSSLLR